MLVHHIGQLVEVQNMTDPNFDVKSAAAVLQSLDQNQNWIRNGGQEGSTGVEDGIGNSRAAPVRTRYAGADTKGTLTVSVPAPTTGVAELLLKNPLDHTLAENTGSFVTALSHAHSRRVDQFCGQYFDPLSSPNILARGRIPADFSKVDFRNELADIHDGSKRVDALHNRLWSPLVS